MKVMGIDPGSRITGLAVVESNNDDIKSLGFHCVRLSNEPLADRLAKIYKGVEAVILEYQPDIVAVEQVFVSKNANSALVLGQARGSAICSAVNQQMQIREYSALQIKKAVVGNGNAKKEQVQHMVRVLLGLTRTPDQDEADALACAICHIHTSQVEYKLSMQT